MIDFDVVLQNDAVTLRPLLADDTGALRSVAFDPAIWRFYAGVLATEEELHAFVTAAVRDRERRARLVFAVVDRQRGALAGSTAFGNLSPHDARLEIGWTWLGTQFHGSRVNRNAKLLLLTYAFEVAECARVEFKTDVLNVAARRALVGIGAVEEGILRSHTLMPGGRRRDTIYYSVLAAEWPAVKRCLLERC